MGPCTHFTDEEREVLEQSASAAITNTIDWVAETTEMYCLTFWRPGAKVLAGLVSPETSLLGRHAAPFLLCPHMVYEGS